MVLCLFEFFNYSISVLESGEQLDVIYTDIRKVFDRLNHSILLKKAVWYRCAFFYAELDCNISK